MPTIILCLFSEKSFIQTPLQEATRKLGLLFTVSSSNTHHLEMDAIIENHTEILLLKKLKKTFRRWHSKSPEERVSSSSTTGPQITSSHLYSM